jgi:glutamyl-tRNA reductase
MLLLLGCNHRSGPVAFREQLAFREDDLPGALERLRRRPGIEEGLIVSTCNRVEVLARAAASGGTTGLHALQEFLCAERRVNAEQLERHTYHFMAREAAQHVFRVACGLDSQILGEPQILGQVRAALRLARDHGSIGPVLGRLMDHCLSAAKRVRTETGISRYPVSVAYAGVHLARRIFGGLQGRTALLLGAGKMSQLVAEHLVSQGVEDLRVASRTYNHALALAERVKGRAVPWDAALAQLGQADVVVGCTGAPQPILGRAEVARARRARRGKPLLLIDIAVPRDVDPRANELDNVYLYDIDGLQDVAAAGLEERRRSAETAEVEIRREVEAFYRWRQSQEVTPLIVALREQWLDVGQAEIERFRRRLGPLAPEQLAAVEGLTRAMVQKMLHRPLTYLRRAAECGSLEHTSALYREVFGVSAAGRGTSPESAAEEAQVERPPHAAGDR